MDSSTKSQDDPARTPHGGLNPTGQHVGLMASRPVRPRAWGALALAPFRIPARNSPRRGPPGRLRPGPPGSPQNASPALAQRHPPGLKALALAAEDPKNGPGPPTQRAHRHPGLDRARSQDLHGRENGRRATGASPALGAQAPPHRFHRPGPPPRIMPVAGLSMAVWPARHQLCRPPGPAGPAAAHPARPKVPARAHRLLKQHRTDPGPRADRAPCARPGLGHSSRKSRALARAVVPRLSASPGPASCGRPDNPPAHRRFY